MSVVVGRIRMFFCTAQNCDAVISTFVLASIQ